MHPILTYSKPSVRIPPCLMELWRLEKGFHVTPSQKLIEFFYLMIWSVLTFKNKIMIRRHVLYEINFISSNWSFKLDNWWDFGPIEWWTRNNQAPHQLFLVALKSCLQTKYKNTVVTIFYKIHFRDFLSTYRILLSNTL